MPRLALLTATSLVRSRARSARAVSAQRSEPRRTTRRRAAFAAVLALLLTSLTLTSAQASPTAPPSSALSSVVTVLDSSNGVLPVRAAVRAWSRGGANLALQLGSCSGRGCIVVSSVTAMAPGTCFVSTAGCSWMSSDGTCNVAVDNTSLDSPYISRYAVLSVTTHEIGHCLGLPHLPALTSIMHNPMSSTDPVRTPSAADLAYLCGVWNGSIPPFIP